MQESPAPTRSKQSVALILESAGAASVMGLVAFAVWFARAYAGPALLPQSIAYVAEVALGLCALYLLWGPCARSYFNPLIALAQGIMGDTPWRRVAGIIMAQTAGAFIGAFLVSLVTASAHLDALVPVAEGPSLVREALAAFALVLLFGGLEGRGWYVRGAALGVFSALTYWVPGVTSFANPAIFAAACASSWDLAAGGSGLTAQATGGVLAALLARWLFRPPHGPH